MLGHGLLDRLVDGEQGLAGTPVHLADELAAEGVDDTGNRGLLALANVVKVKHALDSLGLHAVDEASRLVVEEGVLGRRAQRPTRGLEATNVVIGRQSVAVGRAVGSSGHDGRKTGCADAFWGKGKVSGAGGAVSKANLRSCVTRAAVRCNWVRREVGSELGAFRDREKTTRNRSSCEPEEGSVPKKQSGRQL